jgi:methionyl aminopeptidase
MNHTIYQNLGKRHDEIERLVLRTIRPDVKVADICLLIESELGKEIAFPVGINRNHCAAHYSLLDLDDPTVFTKDDVVKIDFGIQKDGIILDAAFTVAFDNRYRELLDTSRKACMEGAAQFRHNRPLIEVSHAIQKEIKEPFGAIRDLCGHQIKPYLIHGGKVVPNVIIPYREKALEGEIYTVEPFVSTNRNPETENGTDISHFMYNYYRHSFSKSSSFLSLCPTLYSYQTLALNSRWLPEKEQKTLIKLVEKDIYHSYPPIYERDKNAKVAQFETTLMVTKQGSFLYKKYDSVDPYIIV